MNVQDMEFVVNPWQAAVVVTFLVVTIGLPQWFAWANSRKAKAHAKDAADTISHETTNNSGATMRDAIDRIEKIVNEVKGEQVNQGGRIAALEAAAQKRGRTWWR